MAGCITKVLSKFDIFGSQVGLNYNYQNMFQTSFGGFISFIFITFISIFFWGNVNFNQNYYYLLKVAFYQNYFYNITRSPHLLTKFFKFKSENISAQMLKYYNPNPEFVVLNSQRFMFAVRIGQDDFITKPLFNVTLEWRDYITQQNGTKQRVKIPIPLEKCTIEHWKNLPSFGTNWTSVAKTFNLESYLCPRINQTFQLGGNYLSQHFQHMKFTVSKCQNNQLSTALWKPICASDAEVDDFFTKNQNVRFEIYLNNFLINPLQKEDYIQTFTEENIFFSVQRTGVNYKFDYFIELNQIIQKQAYTTADIFLTEQTVITDESILPFKNIKNDTYLTFQAGNFRQQYTIGTVGIVYGDFFLRKDAFNYVYKRSFQKISEIISYIGGFAQIFILISAIIVNYYNEYIYSLSLANKIYDFQFENKGKCKKDNQTLKNDKELSSPNANILNSSKDEMKKDQLETNSYVKSNKNKDTVTSFIQMNQIQLMNTNNDFNKNIKQQIKNFTDYTNQTNQTECQQFENYMESIPDILEFAKIQDYAANKMYLSKSPKSCFESIRQTNEQLESKENFNEISILQLQSQNKKYKQESLQNMTQQKISYSPFNKDYCTETNDLIQDNSQSQIKYKDNLDHLDLSNIPQSDLEPNKKKELLTREFEILLNRDTSLKMTFKFFLNKLTCGKFFNSEQVQLIKKANKQMKKDLDIFIILNRLKDLEKFKALFLEREQEVLFNFFPKPIISIHHNNQQNISRAEMTEKVKKRTKEQSQDTTIQSPTVDVKQQVKRSSTFKDQSKNKRLDIQQRLLNQGLNMFDTIATYEQLYNAFLSILSQGSSKQILIYIHQFNNYFWLTKNRFNSKLVELLGKEMNEIFYRIGRPRNLTNLNFSNYISLNPDMYEHSNSQAPKQFQLNLVKQNSENSNTHKFSRYNNRLSFNKHYQLNISEAHNQQNQ